MKISKWLVKSAAIGAIAWLGLGAVAEAQAYGYYGGYHGGYHGGGWGRPVYVERSRYVERDFRPGPRYCAGPYRSYYRTDVYRYGAPFRGYGYGYR